MCVLRALPAALQVDSFCFSVSSRALKSRGNSGEGAEPPGSPRPRPPHGAPGGGKSPLLALGGHRNSHGGRKGPREIIGTKPHIMGSSPLSLWSMVCVSPPGANSQGSPQQERAQHPPHLPASPQMAPAEHGMDLRCFCCLGLKAAPWVARDCRVGDPDPCPSSGGCGEGLGLTPLTV